MLDTPLTEEEWEACCTVMGMLTPNGNLCLLHYKYLHQIYYTPARLHKYGLRADARCQRCHGDNADFIHLAWNFPLITTYWSMVVEILSKMLGVTIECTIQTCLLGLLKHVHAMMRKFCMIALLLAKRRISLQWNSRLTPKVKQWLHDMAYCRNTLTTYEEELPAGSKSQDFWLYLVEYLKMNPTD